MVARSMPSGLSTRWERGWFSEFGNEGLAVWVCLLAAAKRSINEGVVSYTTEADFWNQHRGRSHLDLHAGRLP